MTDRDRFYHEHYKSPIMLSSKFRTNRPPPIDQRSVVSFPRPEVGVVMSAVNMFEYRPYMFLQRMHHGNRIRTRAYGLMCMVAIGSHAS